MILRIYKNFLRWRKSNELKQLDMDMQCSNMSLDEYLEEYVRISREYDNIK